MFKIHFIKLNYATILKITNALKVINVLLLTALKTYIWMNKWAIILNTKPYYANILQKEIVNII
jgi:hypothetical protein